MPYRIRIQNRNKNTFRNGRFCNILVCLATQSPATVSFPPATDTSHNDAAKGNAFAFGTLALALGALWFVCCRHLSQEWRFNEQYSYGWFVPFFCAYLFWLRWEDRPKRSRKWKGESRKSRGGETIAFILILVSALILLPLRVFEIASADWRPLGWVHAFAVVTITLAIIYLIGGWSWVRHFSFPVLFFLTAVPWVTAIEAPIIEGLMRGIASIAAETLALFGVPASAQGNLVRLPSGVVGVNEACSGVRSLQTSIMIGLLFGELKRLSARHRILLIAAGLTIALLANFIRVMFLVSMASSAHDISVVDKWHNVAGYGILVLVFLGTMWLASKVGKSEAEIRKAKVEDDGATGSVPSGEDFDDTEVVSPASHSAIRIPQFPFLPSTFYFLLLFIWFGAVEAGAEGWYRWHERDATATPSFSVRWPQDAPSYREIKIDERVRELLRFSSGREAVWKSANTQDSLFFFRWNAGSGTILRARAHRPDICLPSAGWRQLGSDRVQSFPVDENLSLPFRVFTFANGANAAGYRAHAYYCLHEDRVHQAEKSMSDLYSNWDFADRWRVVKNGIRNLGQQVLEVIILAPASADDETVDRQFNSILRQTVTENAEKLKS